MAIAMDVRVRRWACDLLVAVMLPLVSVPAQAQYIRIPDFRNSPPPTAPATRTGEVCENCGVIRAIREIQDQRAIPVPRSFQNDPADQGGAGGTLRVGAVVALPMSNNTSSDQGYVGGVGTPEMRARFSQSTYEITVHLDNGATNVTQRRDGANFRIGDRVRMRGIDLELISP